MASLKGKKFIYTGAKTEWADAIVTVLSATLQAVTVQFEEDNSETKVPMNLFKKEFEELLTDSEVTQNEEVDEPKTEELKEATKAKKPVKDPEASKTPKEPKQKKEKVKEDYSQIYNELIDYAKAQGYETRQKKNYIGVCSGKTYGALIKAKWLKVRSEALAEMKNTPEFKDVFSSTYNAQFILNLPIETLKKILDAGVEHAAKIKPIKEKKEKAPKASKKSE